MRRLLPALLLLATLPQGGCSSRQDAAPPAPSAATPVTAQTPSATPVTAQARFEVIDLLDLQRQAISRFAYSRATQELFVSFDPGNKLEQWSVPEKRLLHTYPIPEGFMVDEITPSPDGHRLVVALYHASGGVGGRWEKYALLDAVKHEVISADLGIYNDRAVKVAFNASGDRLRLTTSGNMGGDARELYYDVAGRPVAAAPADFPPRQKGKVWVIESSKATLDTHGLYYTDADGKDYRVTQAQWNGNYDITRDGRYVVTTTGDGEILAWSTAEKAVVFHKKIAENFGYLAYDDKNDRFLLGDATNTGTTKLRALVREEK